jgi:hypothetical protein
MTLALSSAVLNHGIRICNDSFQTENQLAQMVKRAFVYLKDSTFPWRLIDHGVTLALSLAALNNGIRICRNSFQTKNQLV